MKGAGGCLWRFPPVRNVDLPSASIRISDRQLRLLIADVKPIVCASLTIKAGWFSLADLPGFTAERRRHQLDIERPRQLLDAALIAFWRRLNRMSGSGQSRHRLQLDYFEANACAIGLRLGRRVRKPDPASSIPNTPEMSLARSQFLRRVENLIRRLKRKLTTEAGERAAADLKRLFDDYRRGIMNALYPRWPDWVHTGALRQVYKSFVEHAVGLAVEGLLELGVPNGDPDELRLLVRRFLTYCRRGRTGLSVLDLVRDPATAKMRLVSFIRKCRKKQSAKRKTKNSRRKEDVKALDIARKTASACA
jgi:hypothetical protein